MKSFTWILIALMTSSAAFAQDDRSSNDFSRERGEIKKLNADELSYRLHIVGEIFILSADGKSLINVAQENRRWEFSGSKKLSSNWSWEAKQLTKISLQHEWTLDQNGALKVRIRQYDSIERDGADIKYGKLIKEQDFDVTDFAPIEWPVTAGDKRLVVRFSPSVWPDVQSVDAGRMPISGRNMVIYDGKGRVWADQVDDEHPSTFMAVVTHLGSVYLSFTPFKGAKKIGEAKNAHIKIHTENGKLMIQSETPFTPVYTRLNVYGLIVPDNRTDGRNKVRSYSTDREEEFLKLIGK